LNINSDWLDDNRGLIRNYSGELCISDILEATLELHDSPLFPALQYIIEDHTNTTNRPFSRDDVHVFSNFVRMRANTKDDLKVAIISRDSPDSINTANGFSEQMKLCHYQCQVFLSLSSAQTWARKS